MKKLLLSILLCTMLWPAAPAAAHVLEFDNGIGAVLHIDPQDDPVAGEQTTFYFEFSDKSGTFNAEACDCSLVIAQNGNELQKLPVTVQAPDALSARYVFPIRGTYELILNGKPANGSTFPDFKLRFAVRVDKGNGITQVTTDYKAIYITALGIAGCILFLALRAIVISNVKYHAEHRIQKPRNDDRSKPRKPRV